jgi:hypothetical protein
MRLRPGDPPDRSPLAQGCEELEMLEDLLKKAVEIGADQIEIECEDGARLVSAFRGPTGIGIAWLDAAQWNAVYEQMKGLKKKRRAVLGGVSYRLAFSQYQSFDEWIFVIRIKRAK